MINIYNEEGDKVQISVEADDFPSIHRVDDAGASSDDLPCTLYDIGDPYPRKHLEEVASEL